MIVLAFASSSRADGQFTNPYNPDEDGNGFIGVSDLSALLSHYGGVWNSDSLVVARADELPLACVDCISPCMWPVVPDSVDVLFPPADSLMANDTYSIYFKCDQRDKPLAVFGDKDFRQQYCTLYPGWANINFEEKDHQWQVEQMKIYFKVDTVWWWR